VLREQTVKRQLPTEPGTVNLVSRANKKIKSQTLLIIVLTMEAVSTAETSTGFEQNTRRNITEDSHIQLVAARTRSLTFDYVVLNILHPMMITILLLISLNDSSITDNVPQSPQRL
jgi:hypothetical protein